MRCRGTEVAFALLIHWPKVRFLGKFLLILMLLGSINKCLGLESWRFHSFDVVEFYKGHRTSSYEQKSSIEINSLPELTYQISRVTNFSFSNWSIFQRRVEFYAVIFIWLAPGQMEWTMLLMLMEPILRRDCVYYYNYNIKIQQQRILFSTQGWFCHF